VPIEIYEKQVVPCLLFRRPGLYLCKVDAVLAKRLEHLVKCPHAILDREDYGCLVAARPVRGFFGKDQETGEILLPVPDVPGKYPKPV